MSHCSLWPWFSTQKAVLDSLGRWEIPTENHRSQWGLKNPRPFSKTERTVYSLYIVYWDIFRCIMDIMEWICQGCCRNADSRRGIFWKVLSESARLMRYEKWSPWLETPHRNPLVNIQNAIEHGDVVRGCTHSKCCWFSISFHRFL